MKKVKITLKASSQGKKFSLFPSAEALYVWLCAVERNEQVHVPDIEDLVLEPGDFIEAELRGFEYVYEEGQKHRRLDLVRLGKAHQPNNASGLLVTIHVGWVSGGLMPLKRYSDSDVDVRSLDQHDAKIDLPFLFGDEDAFVEEDVDLEEGDDGPPDSDE